MNKRWIIGILGVVVTLIVILLGVFFFGPQRAQSTMSAGLLCVNSHGSFWTGRCLCPKGYEFSGDGYCFIPHQSQKCRFFQWLGC
jgi:hypothetical protein